MKKKISKYTNMFQVGEKFGKWTVQDDTIFFEIEGEHHFRASVLVKCECGLVKKLAARFLKNSKGCYDCTRPRLWGPKSTGWKGVGLLSGLEYGRLKRQAKVRNVEFCVTKQDLWNVYEKQNGKCALSGLDIEIIPASYKKNRRAKQTASLDRIDSSKGYTTDNIHWVHKDINMMKNAYELGYFKRLCRLVASNCTTPEVEMTNFEIHRGFKN